MKKDFLEIIVSIFIFVAIICMVISKNIEIRIISAIIVLVYITVSNLSIYLKRKRIINEVNNNENTYICCKEKKYRLILPGLLFILSSISNIRIITDRKVDELVINSGKEVYDFMDFISRITIDERVTLLISTVINILMIILGITYIIEALRSFVIISNDRIIFYDLTEYKLSEITDIKYRETLFFKSKVIDLYRNDYKRKIVLKQKDFEKIKNYLDDNIVL